MKSNNYCSLKSLEVNRDGNVIFFSIIEFYYRNRLDDAFEVWYLRKKNSLERPGE